MSSVSSTRSKLRKAPPRTLEKSTTASIPNIHWLFRSNIPRRRTSYITPDIRKRNFFGMSEILGVITNPAETVRSLTESKRLLEEARREINEQKERSQIRTKHTFSRLPGFFGRKAELQAVERALENEPSFTILFGASSVGKTALLREVLSRPAYHVLHFDLRIAGFADLASLYMSLSTQMQQYFEEIATNMEGYEEFEKEAWGFKHDRLSVERRLAEDKGGNSRIGHVKTSDVARLMEMFQSSLLKYWEFQPRIEEKRSESGSNSSNRSRRQATEDSSTTKVERNGTTRSRWGLSWGRSKHSQNSSIDRTQSPQLEKGKGKEPPPKKMPVIFFDEAHKLPALIQSTETMKCLLDSMLVLTKQDRLCHVIHATSDPFYQTWLRQLNVMQHCKIITIGDCSKNETRKYYRERVLPRVPERLRGHLNFETLYDAFGGKLAHWHDYITDYINSNGTIDIKQSSHFLQAHALLNLHIIHSSQAPTNGNGQPAEGESQPGAANMSNADTLHPGLGPAGFKIYSPLTHPHAPHSFASMSDSGRSAPDLYAAPEFNAMQLLKVMSRLARPDTPYLPYFHLCRELGVRAVDGMVKGRVLDLRWTEAVTKEFVEEPRVRSSMVPPSGPSSMPAASQSALNQSIPVFVSPGGTNITTSTSGPATSRFGSASHVAMADHADLGPPPPIDDDDEMMIPVSEAEIHGHQDPYEEILEVVGPKLVPMTPIMRYAMRDVVQEYEDDQSMSEYASLSDVDEY